MNQLTCEQAMQQFFVYLDRALSGEPLEALEAHLEACLHCCERLEFSRHLDRFIKSRLPEATMPADLEAKVRRVLAH